MFIVGMIAGAFLGFLIAVLLDAAGEEDNRDE